jgi:hypothetical protein
MPKSKNNQPTSPDEILKQLESEIRFLRQRRADRATRDTQDAAAQRQRFVRRRVLKKN